MTDTFDPVLRWSAARIPVKLRGRTLEDLALPGSVIGQAREFVDTFPRRHVPDTTPMSEYPDDRSLIGCSLLLSGPPKAGKTSLGCAVLTEVALTAPAYPPVTILFVPFADYMHLFNERHGWRQRTGEATFEESLLDLEVTLSMVMDTSLVLFDDIGAEHNTASRAASDELHRVLRSRERRGLVSITTTSLSMQALYEAYTPALADVLVRGGDHIEVTVTGKRA